MSKQVGARTHASAALAPHVSRVAAVGLAVFLTFGYGAAAQADEGSDVSGVGGAAGLGGVSGTSDVEVGGTADVGDGTADAGRDARPEGWTATGSDDEPGRPGKADGTIEISATSSDTDLVTLVVVTADGGRTTTVTPGSDAADSLVAGPGQLRRTDAPVAVAAAGKENQPGKDNKPVDTEPGHKPVDTDPDDATEPESGKPEDAGHQEVVVCHNGRTIVVDSNGLNGHGKDELCAPEPADNSADSGGQNSAGGDGSDAGGEGGGEATTGDASAGDATVGTGGTGDGVDTGSEGGDSADTSSEGGDGAGIGGEGGDGATADEQGSTGAEERDAVDEREGVDETAPGHSEPEGGSSDGSAPKGENGTEVVVALPGADGTVEGGPVTGQPGAGEPGTGKPADQVKGDEADRSGTVQPVGERAAGSRPVASPTGSTGATKTAIAPDSARLAGQRTGDEILGAAEGSARNRPAALVLPQTGAAESLGIQTGVGLLMVLAGVMTLRGRRRSTG